MGETMTDVARAVTEEFERMHSEGVPIVMREGETTWRTYHAGFDLSAFSQRIVDAVLAASPVPPSPPREEVVEALRNAKDILDELDESTIRSFPSASAKHIRQARDLVMTALSSPSREKDGGQS